MPKPSERIKEIAEQMVEDHGKCSQCGFGHHKPVYQQYLQEATFNYLDEEYKRNQPVEITCSCGDSEYCGIHSHLV